ncbi:NAD(P)/FAD-dependent oxidoreductase [Paraflavitalea sp. CAU 1676]|uniref:NAD(P)/FAD-dependent oxidoreductase n=1 Tax=Paraflavitalea sp. CAU 1676 TaxID=3032598 RepID=UPI0023DA94DF|nr:NAD(P)/FAD-dependent oxidoreductase [Paraflavitalea sp. CAU 1676]MDF2192607.1 NAD(P)/FAD-dependent oxidoreductase [Paraflavitalea sp. CAU 1676]
MPKKAIIIGAGPAGLTAAYELLKRTDIKPIVIEKCGQVGGISKTVSYKGNKMDFGPHRFFSKSDRVMNWWTNIMPLHTPKGEDLTISYQNKSRTIETGNFLTTEETDGRPPQKSMMVIQRLTRIYFLRQFFAYPIQLSIATLGQLGILTTIKIVFSYLYARLFPRKPQNSLEDFMINKFGSVLYHIFFKDYTEKVWGMDCNKISADWGAQRIKGVSLSKAVIHAAKALTKKRRRSNDINQKNTETSLIEQFLYPATGAGAMWEEVARQVEVMGGKIVNHYEVKHILTEGDNITGIEALNTQTGQLESLEGDYFFSTMPVKELIGGMKAEVPVEVKEIADGLIYRDFVYAGVLVRKMTMATPKDSWIYIQEKDVRVARMQVYNNWGPYMVADPNTVWLGLEYFCTKGDAIWNMTDEEIKELAVKELIKMDLITLEDVLDSTVNRMEKTYPAYFGTYDRFELIQNYLERFANLFLVGRNGMHKYNNTDHSMLTAMVAVDNICDGVASKTNLWEINTEQDYHEEKKEAIQKHKQAVSHQQLLQNNSGELVSPISFQAFLLQNKLNRRTLWLTGFAIIIQFFLFKYLYPFANYIHGDSFSYIKAASSNSDINTHMIGYSRFLRLFSVFSDSDTALVFFQYMLAQASGLYFIFTLFYFHKVSKAIQLIITGITVISPLILHLSNLISSDCLFMSLSIIWLTLLIWLIHKPSNKIIFWHTAILFLAFFVRYNALLYPLIAFLAYYLAKIPISKKLIGVSAPILLCGLFIIYTANNYKTLTGVWQYAPFSGWQAANNAMYAYRYVNSSERKPVPPKFQLLDNMIRSYFDSTRNTRKYPVEKIKASTIYMWTPTMPLYKYRNKVLIESDTNLTEFKKWALMGPIYKEYGTLIIRQYPLEYARHFLWPNTIKYYAPPTEFLEYYNGGKDSVPPIVKSWFNYNSRKLTSRLNNPKIYILEIYPILIGIMNIVLLSSLLCFIVLRRSWENNILPRTITIAASIWLLNAAFTIISSPAAIRLQAFPMILETVFALLLVDWLWKQAFSINATESFKTKYRSPQTNLSRSRLA